MSNWAPKRFWKQAEVREADGGFAVTLDGRGVKTPAKAPLVLPTRAMAAAIAAEWDAQHEMVDPTTMPNTRSANAAIDKVARQFDEVAEMLLQYGDTDLLCYRAHSPVELVSRQAAHWDPLLDWAEQTFGARLQPRQGVIHAAQPDGVLDRLRGPVFAMNPFQMAAFHDLVSLTGSLILGLAATRRAWTENQLWTLSRLDETWQEEQWGADEEATELAERKKSEFLHACRFYQVSTG
ncbi:ATP12 family protein [Mesobacterium sp. TK19101]|uniref:ATP12 family protein n=1 Tax=Mesobacterium hydrothermale TaxID=3111907 RepID=A0ABU6HH52_9RHOB|nr:ATP12 family protein [Mesobacterium sp. TK19101]MEC3861432.1 ATP12 family protein [Mesobacterium sp. TK19101]